MGFNSFEEVVRAAQFHLLRAASNPESEQMGAIGSRRTGGLSEASVKRKVEVIAEHLEGGELANELQIDGSALKHSGRCKYRKSCAKEYPAPQAWLKFSPQADEESQLKKRLLSRDVPRKCKLVVFEAAGSQSG